MSKVLDDRIWTLRRRYKKSLENMKRVIESELEQLKNSPFEPSASVDSAAFHVIQENNRLKSLIEFDEDHYYKMENEESNNE